MNYIITTEQIEAIVHIGETGDTKGMIKLMGELKPIESLTGDQIDEASEDKRRLAGELDALKKQDVVAWACEIVWHPNPRWQSEQLIKVTRKKTGRVRICKPDMSSGNAANKHERQRGCGFGKQADGYRKRIRWFRTAA